LTHTAPRDYHGRNVSSALRLVPLGGLGEIGMNCMAVETDDSIVVLDCGVMFPDRGLGVDVIHPDFSYLLERRRLVRAIVLTHGHEDHIGAVPYLLRHLDVPVYGPPYALALVRERLREHDLLEGAELIPTRPRARYAAGSIDFEPVRVTHSIADATALALRTPAGLFVHTGDFKIDESLRGDEAFDAERFAELGDEGVRALLSDSTNVDVAGTSGSEAGVDAVLGDLIARAPARIVIAMFASNAQRLRGIIAATRAAGRQLCFLGRSVQLHARVAVEEHVFEDPGAMLVPPDRVQSVPRDRLVVVATGTQGEPAAALARLAAETHPSLRLEPGDTVVLSSRIIPGHERTVSVIINDLERLGAIVRSPLTDPGVHVSGHAQREEQRRMIALTRPSGFLPVHGTFHHLSRHAALAHEAGVGEHLVVENGAIVEVDRSAMRIVGHAPVGRISVDAGEEIPESVLRDRALLAESGVAMAVLVVDSSGRRLVQDPDIVTRGVLQEEASSGLIADARADLADAVYALRSPLDRVDDETLRELARRTMKRFFARELGRKPLTYAVVVRVPR
jgi:ribonuclease J